MVEKKATLKRPKFRNEAEEAEWLWEHRDEIEWRPVLDEEGRPLSPAQIRDRELNKRQQSR